MDLEASETIEAKVVAEKSVAPSILVRESKTSIFSKFEVFFVKCFQKIGAEKLLEKA